MKNIINNIRGHHFNLGDSKNDFGTTTGVTYVYDPSKAQGAKGSLDSELKNDLRATHYKLGYMKDNNSGTTHQSAYVPKPVEQKMVHDPNLRKSHINLNPSYKNNLDAQTIYMADFTRKEITN